MKYEKLYDDFAELFPDDTIKLKQIAVSVDAEPSDGMHIMFGMVVIPFIMDLLKNNEYQKLKTAFTFFERMAETDKPMISEVLEFSILEDIISQGKDTLNKCRNFMGKKTLESCDSIEKYMM